MISSGLPTVLVDDQWIEIKTMVKESISSQLLTKSRQHMDRKTWRLSALTKKTRLQNRPDYRYLSQEVKCFAPADLQRYWTKLANNIEAVARFGKFQKLLGLRASRLFQKLIKLMLADILSHTSMRNSTDGQHISKIF